MPRSRRTAPLPSAPVAILTVLCRQALTPTAFAAVAGAVVVAPFAWLTSAPHAGAVLWLQWVAAFAVSMVAHELAHVLARRRGVPGAWRVESSWTGLVVVGPDPAVGPASVLAGPLVGASVVAAGAVAGLSAWVWVPLLTLHLVNLTPVCPDGRVLLEIT